MSIEIRGLNDRDIEVTNMVGDKVASMLVDRGASLCDAYTLGQESAGYAAAIIFTVLRKMGVVEDGFNVDRFMSGVETINRSPLESELPFVN